MKRILKNVVMIIITLASISGIIFASIYFNKDNSNNMSGGTPPNMQGNGDMGLGNNTPPEKPDNDSDMSTPPEKPDGENNDMESNQSMKMSEDINQTSNNKVWFYVIVISLSLLVAINIGYLIISNFNAKTFKETFGVADKTIIFVLLTIIITAVLSFTSIWFNGTKSQNNQPNNGNMNGSMNNKTPSYSSSNEISSDKTISDETYTSSTASENAVLISGDANATMDNVIVTKTGDAETGTSKFTAKNSTITTNKGDTLYVTNTDAVITLENNTIINNDSTGNFLRIQKDSWGTTGQNGGSVTLTLKNQTATGNIVVDSISTLSMKLTDSSSLEGSINSSNEAKSITLKLSKNSKIKLTGDSYVKSLDDEDTSYKNIDFNGYKLYVNGKSVN